MKTTLPLPLWMRFAPAILLLFAFTFPAQAANECQVYYSYTNNSGNTRSQTLNLDEGETQSVGTNGIRVIQNKENYPVRVEITALGPIPNQRKWVTLNNSGDQDPPFSVYPAPVTLYQIECGGSSFGSAADMLSTLQNAGVSTDDIIRALRSTFDLSGPSLLELLLESNIEPIDIARPLSSVLRVNAEQVITWLQDAGVPVDSAARILRQSFRLNLNDVAEVLRNVYGLSIEATAEALQTAGFAASQVNQWLANLMSINLVISGHTSGYFATPSSNPNGRFPLHYGTNNITISGLALFATTAINGFPPGSSVQIVGRGPGPQNSRGIPGSDYIHVQIDIPTTARNGLRGSATLRLSSSNGPRFNWVIQRPSNDNGTRVPNPVPPTTGGGNSNLPDLVVMPSQVRLYLVGTATTLDDNGDTFTALDPFNNSPHCQGIAQGTTGNNNLPTSNTRRIRLPDIRWGVENDSNVAINTPFTVELWQGNQLVATQQVRRLGRRGRATFSYRRPQSVTTVARVGQGQGCYHFGLSSAGWNDNPGYTVRVDTNEDIEERRENNNAGNL